MRSSLERRSSWLYFALAFLGALSLWYSVNAREQVERVVEVRLDYKGLPPGLTITSGQLNKISVRLRGPLELLRSLNSRELATTIDVSSLTVGTNVIPLGTDEATRTPGLRGYQVVEVMPSRLNLDVDRVLEARVPVEARLRESPFASSIKLTRVQIQPATVMVRGPSAEVTKLQKVMVELPVHLNQEGVVITDDNPVVAPPFVEVSPTTVSVTRLMDVQRRTISLQRDIIIDNTDLNLNVAPTRVTLRISIPSGSLKDAGYLAQIQASIEPESAMEHLSGALANLTSTAPAGAVEPALVPVKISLPQGAGLISVNPEKVKLTLIK